MKLFNITNELTGALSIFDKALVKLEKVRKKAAKQYTKAQGKLLEAEDVVKRTESAIGEISRIVGGNK
jgi:hypothetical protein